MTAISEQAAIHPSARIGTDVTIGPFCVIGPDVTIEDGTCLMNNITVDGNTRIGPHNIIYPNVVIGVASQDLKYKGAPTRTIIGAHNIIRELVTIHRGTELGGEKTVVGDHNLLMIGVHVAHDCIIADRTIIGNQVHLAGHINIDDGAVISALCGVHNFVRVGKYSYVGGMTPVRRDVPPFMKFEGSPNAVRGVNEEGLKRHNFSPDTISAVKNAYRKLYRQNRDIQAALDELENQPDLSAHVRHLCEFVRSSCAGRFGRFHELERNDTAEDRRHGPYDRRQPRQSME